MYKGALYLLTTVFSYLLCIIFLVFSYFFFLCFVYVSLPLVFTQFSVFLLTLSCSNVRYSEHLSVRTEKLPHIEAK